MRKLSLIIALVLVLFCVVSCSLTQHVHSFGQWETIKAPTSTESGERARYCDCGEKQSEVIYATGEEDEDKSDVIEIVDGYLVVNGEKTEHKVHSEPTLSVIDGYVAVNGVKTPYKVDTDDVITVEDGYLVVNGEKTEHKVHTEPVISVIDGYIAVNGVKSEYKIDTEDVITVEDGYLVVNGVKTEHLVSQCNHIWETVTTAPTCTSGGFDTATCVLCQKSVIINETEKADHTYNKSYSFDDNHHWFNCTGCDHIKDKEVHDVNDDGVCNICLIPLSATPGVIYDLSADGSYAEVIDYKGSATKVKIASEYKGVPVKSIFDGAFMSNDLLVSVILPEGITTIGDHAFAYCYQLVSINIPESVEDIMSYAFQDCNSLASITLPDGITRINDYVFDGCISMSSITIPDSVTCIGASSFQNCVALTSIVIPQNVTEIRAYAFQNCDNLKFNEFDNCKYLGSENNPYFALIQTKNTVYSNYELHPETRILANEAFYECSRLVKITLPNKVTHIGFMAFCSCSSLKSIFIPKSVVAIDGVAFAECNSFTDTYYMGSEEEWSKITIGSENGYLLNSTIHFNYEATEEHFSAGLEFTSNGDGTCYVSGIGSCTDTSIVIPSVAYSVSDGNGGTMDLPVPEPVVGIGLAAFENCKLITEVIIPDSIVYISDDAFNGCSSLKSISIPDGVSSIGSAFQDCSSLESILLPKELTRIEVCTFAGCTGLKEITVQDKLEVICENAFCGCSSLKHLYYTGSANQWLKIDIHTSFYSWLTDLEMHCEHTL